ncbi:MAG: dienelactone hydrolase family protein [Actinomycetota bacterium]
MFENEIRVETLDGVMTTFVAHPDGDGPFPVAVLYMDGVGYRDQVKENARRFAAGGYYVVAPDLFYRSGAQLTFDWSATDEVSRERMMAAIRSLSPEKVRADTEAALASIAGDPAAAAEGPMVTVGYCMGARYALHAAAGEGFVAAAGIHPGALATDAPDSPHLDLASVRGEVYFAFAEIDRSATPELIDRFREEVERQGVRGQVERIPGVTHGFAMADLPVYDPGAAERQFERVLELWRRNLTVEPVEG